MNITKVTCNNCNRVFPVMEPLKSDDQEYIVSHLMCENCSTTYSPMYGNYFTGYGSKYDTSTFFPTKNHEPKNILCDECVDLFLRNKEIIQNPQIMPILNSS